jgi:UDP-N-acetylmuramoyl-tripeptide--D-alanyl-D-alanine ligase
MKTLVLKILRAISAQIIKRHRPYVVAITGTVGKSTAAHFLSDALGALYGTYSVGVSVHNYNGEFGVPLTIMQSSSPHSNPFMWIAVFFKGLWLAFFAREYPKYLVLEYGIDHPGEMDFLTSICEPDVAVMLAISRNHVANFESYDQYVAEKLKLIPKSKNCVINADDSKIRRYLSEHPHEHVLSVGRKSVEPVDFRAVNVQSTLE